MLSNDIWFDPRHRDDLGVLEVVPHVDGVALTELIDRFEDAAGMRPAVGAYGGLIPRYFRFGPMEDHFHGRSTNAMGPKTPLLGCQCGEWGCWPLMGRVAVTDDHVVWDAFEQPRRPGRDYRTFGPFRFERRRYDNAVRELSTALDAG